MTKLKSLNIVFATKDEFINEVDSLLNTERPILTEEREITFNSKETFNKVLTPNRLTIIKTIAKQGPRSINQLAKLVAREQPHVHKDCKYLEVMGFIVLVENKGAKKQYTPKLSYDYDVIWVSCADEDDFFPITSASHKVLLDSIAS